MLVNSAVLLDTLCGTSFNPCCSILGYAAAREGINNRELISIGQFRPPLAVYSYA
jgi:hypothetical protein